MAKKKTVRKKSASKVVATGEKCSGCCGCCKFCGWVLPILIIVLLWAAPFVTWSKWVMTAAAALLLLGRGCPCRKK